MITEDWFHRWQHQDQNQDTLSPVKGTEPGTEGVPFPRTLQWHREHKWIEDPSSVERSNTTLSHTWHYKCNTLPSSSKVQGPPEWNLEEKRKGKHSWSPVPGPGPFSLVFGLGDWSHTFVMNLQLAEYIRLLQSEECIWHRWGLWIQDMEEL